VYVNNNQRGFMDITSVRGYIKQYSAIKDEVETLTKRQSELKSRLTQTIDEYGSADERGHIVLSVPTDTSEEDDLTIMKQRRVSKNLDMDLAETILTKKGLKDKCIKMVPQIDEAAIMAAFYEGYLTEEDIDTMFPSKVTYAFIVGK
jgi:hypothetical protein